MRTSRMLRVGLRHRCNQFNNSCAGSGFWAFSVGGARPLVSRSKRLAAIVAVLSCCDHEPGERAVDGIEVAGIIWSNCLVELNHLASTGGQVDSDDESILLWRGFWSVGCERIECFAGVDAVLR